MDYKQMCVQQGYVPSTCMMDGQMAWLLIKEGKDPCKGCNYNRKQCNGRYADYQDEMYLLMCTLDLLSEREKRQIEENKRKHEEIMQKRKERHMKNSSKTILEIKSELHREFMIEVASKRYCKRESIYYKMQRYI